MAVQDKIERTILLPASRERVWRAVTEPAQISRWFGEVTMDFRVGGAMTFFWDGEEHARARVAAIDPPRHFAYQWHPGSVQQFDKPFDELPLTLVEFFLEEAPGGTQLTVVETGFAAMPPEIYERVWRENTEGWDGEIGDLLAYINEHPEG